MSHKKFDDDFINIANNMGVPLYGRFDTKGAGLFLRTSEKELESLITSNQINYIKSKNYGFLAISW
ncbi:hypothetical protein [Isorropodon fossajaponicum symbiont]|uniref:hypothetical protein n=1 Tax=Isorropodon fossajaponicum symbiont TaxID=883811 RepID=UPI0019162C4A|nr:hypothetical protein [Isorropodon fossajaponicum symbiont]